MHPGFCRGLCIQGGGRPLSLYASKKHVRTPINLIRLYQGQGELLFKSVFKNNGPHFSIMRYGHLFAHKVAKNAAIIFVSFFSHHLLNF